MKKGRPTEADVLRLRHGGRATDGLHSWGRLHAGRLHAKRLHARRLSRREQKRMILQSAPFRPAASC